MKTAVSLAWYLVPMMPFYVGSSEDTTWQITSVSVSIIDVVIKMKVNKYANVLKNKMVMSFYILIFGQCYFSDLNTES